MKKIYLLAFAVVFSGLSAQHHEEAERKMLIGKEMSRYAKMVDYNVNPNTLNYDLRYQRLELNLDPTQQFVSGTVTSHFIPNTAMSSIYFDLTDNLTVSNVTHRGNSLPFTQLSTKEVKIDFPAALAQNQLDSLSITYSGAPNSGDAFVATDHGSGPVLATLSEPYGAQEWFPTKQSLNDKIEKVDIKIITPSQYSTASNGKLISETALPNNRKLTFWQTNYPIPAYLIALGISNYVKLNDTMGTPPFPYVNYLFPNSAGNSAVISNLNWTKTAMDTFEQYFGPYPYRNEKYGHMQFTWGGGMEHATMSSMGSFSRGLIAHELAHQWFGDKVTCGAWNDIWLNEGFATFGEHLLYEKLLMTPSQFQSYLQDEMDYITSSPGGSTYVADSVLGSVWGIFDGRLSYSKGGYIVRMIKTVLGDDVFYQAIQDYHNRPELAYGYAKTEDLAASLLASTGKDFTEFFNDWVYGQGYPTYQIRWNQTSDQNLIIKVGQTQSHSSVNFFEMPLPIKVNGPGGQVAYLTLDHTFTNQQFVNLVNFPVSSIQFNYERQILQRNSTVVKDTSLLAVDNPAKNDLKIYPNPVKDFISVSGLSGNQPYEIYGVDGKILRTGNYKSGETIDVKSLIKGNYILKINGTHLKFLKH